MTTDTERILLGGWLKGEHIEDLQQVNDKDFFNQQIVRLLKEGKTALEISNLANINIGELMQMTVGVSDFFYKQALNVYLNECIRRELQEMQGSSIDEIKAKLAYIDRTNDTVSDDKNLAVEYLNEVTERSKREIVKYNKLPTLNRLTDGIRRKELTTVAARPAVGKSAFALQVALGVQAAGKKVLYFPLEMSRAQTFDRILCHRGLAESKELRNGSIENHKLQFAVDHIDRLEKQGLFKVYEGVAQLEKIEKAIIQEKPFLVVIDQLTQLKSKKPFGSVREKFSYMTSTLKAIAMREDVAVLLLCQVNRGADNVKPTMANLKESGSIEEDSDNVILLHRLVRENLDNPSKINWQKEVPILLSLSKQRSGETGDFTLLFEPAIFTFFEKA